MRYAILLTNADIHRELKTRAAERGQSLAKYAEAMLAHGLFTSGTPAQRERLLKRPLAREYVVTAPTAPATAAPRRTAPKSRRRSPTTPTSSRRADAPASSRPAPADTPRFDHDALADSYTTPCRTCTHARRFHHQSERGACGFMGCSCREFRAPSPHTNRPTAD